MNTTVSEDIKSILADAGIDWAALKNASVFVTGATGLVGALLVKTLLFYRQQSGGTLKVYALVRDPDKARAMFGADCESKGLVLVQGDVRTPIDLSDPIDYVIHGASVTASKYMVTNPVDTLLTSIRGTENILKLAAQKQVKGAVYLSSMEVYGQTREEDNPITEDILGYVDLHAPRSSYPEGKRACECLCAAFAAQYGVPVRIARLAQTFGAGVSSQDGRVFAQFTRSCMEGTDIVLHTAGMSVGNYCYTADVIRALLILLCHGESGQAYNIVNERTSMQIRQVAQLVSDTLAGGAVKIKFDIPESSLTYGYAPDVTMRLSAAKMRGLGWNPNVDLPEMFLRLRDSWLEGGV